MPVTRYEWINAQAVYTEMAPIDTDKNGLVTRISVPIMGVPGSAKQSKPTVRYVLIADISGLPNDLPDVWVAAPADKQITHVNIHKPSFCPITKSNLPLLCWGSFKDGAWATWPESKRGLLGFLNLLAQNLNDPNPAVKARV